MCHLEHFLFWGEERASLRHNEFVGFSTPSVYPWKHCYLIKCCKHMLWIAVSLGPFIGDYHLEMKTVQMSTEAVYSVFIAEESAHSRVWQMLRGRKMNRRTDKWEKATGAPWPMLLVLAQEISRRAIGRKRHSKWLVRGAHLPVLGSFPNGNRGQKSGMPVNNQFVPL